MRAGVALGSNLGDRLDNLRTARKKIIELPGVTSPELSSSIYETEPVGCEQGAGPFLNAVVEVGYEGEATELLRELRNIEAVLGRPAEHAKNQSRPLDLDLLYFGGQKIDRPGLQVPHPRLPGRRFVLQPLAEIRPDLLLPEQTKTVQEMLASLPDSE